MVVLAVNVCMCVCVTQSAVRHRDGIQLERDKMSDDREKKKKVHDVVIFSWSNTLHYSRASVASETLTGVTQLKIGDVC